MPWQRVSIDLDSSDPAIVRLERHSYINLINVIHAELQLIERMVDLPGSLRSGIHLAEAASRAFKESRVARRHLAELAAFSRLIRSDLDEVIAEAGPNTDDDVSEALQIVHEVLPDAHLRVQEALARHALPRPIERFDVDAFARYASGHGIPVVHNVASEDVELPDGSGEAIRTIVEANDRVRIERIGIEAYPDEPDRTEFTFRASAPDTGTSALLTAGLRPSEIHTRLAELGEPARSFILLAYLSIPGGAANIQDRPESGDFEYVIALARPVPVVDSD